jgi:transposase
MNNNKPEKQLAGKKYSPQFKDQALERIAQDGVRQVEKDLTVFLESSTEKRWRLS